MIVYIYYFRLFFAGPSNTFPSSLYLDPWQGHSHTFSLLLYISAQPKCVHLVFLKLTKFIIAFFTFLNNFNYSFEASS